MKKNVEKEIEDLLAQIEDKYNDQDKISITNFISSIFKKLNLLKILSAILTIILSILMIANGVISLEPVIIAGVLLFIFIVGYFVFRQYQQPVKRWRGEIIDDYYNKKTFTQLIKSFFIKK